MEQKKHLVGLTDAQVEASRQQHGANVLTPPKRESLWKLFLEKFEDPIIRILLVAALLSLFVSFVHKEFAETIGIFCAIFLATGVAFWFEVDANKKFDLLNQVNDDTPVKVIRNNNVCEILKRDVVVGDIVLLGTGEEVPADGVLIEAVSLQINESCLTGEPVISKTTNEADFKKDATYPSNVALRGTTIVDGHGILEITAVGDATEFGKVAEKASEMTGEITPLNKQLDGLAKLISVIGFTLAGLTFLALFLKDWLTGETSYTWQQLGFLGIVGVSGMVAFVKIWMPIMYDANEMIGRKEEMPKAVEEGSWGKWLGLGALTFVGLMSVGYFIGINAFDTSSWLSLEDASQILNYFMVAITLIVVAVPEGLPMSVTLSLAMSMRRMLQTNNLVRKMHACETMGAATVICTDKTGTLTQNKMQVYKTDFFSLDESQQLDSSEQAKLIKEGIATNSTAFLDFSDQTNIKPLGNPTEAALLLWLNDNGENYLYMRENATVLDQLTFSTERKYMATLVASPLLGKNILYVKGAPEIVLNKCLSIHTRRGVEDVADYKGAIEGLLNEYQAQAMRTLGFAYRIVDSNKENKYNIKRLLEDPLTFLGITAISDPVRKDVPDAVAECMSAGIKVKIVTGDTPGTAKEIGRQIGIWSNDDTDECIITGVDFEALSDAEAAERVKKLKIMCRARPTDKQRLVNLLQEGDSIVAVTGDGTNDAPALNHANVGLSMGTGTSVAKEASDITLLDDSFASIATAVMWGRSLYKNIQRFLIFQLTINVAALIIVLLGSIFGEEIPLTVTQMLWVNLIMDTFAAIALASLPPDKSVMKDKPRRNNSFIITPAMGRNILCVGISFVVLLLGLLYYLTTDGYVNPYDLSYFFTVFVMLQFWNMFNAKAFATGRSAFVGISKSLGFIAVALIIFVGQVIIVEFGGEVFRTVPLTLKDWLIIVGSTSFVLWIGEVFRFFTGKKKYEQITTS